MHSSGNFREIPSTSIGHQIHLFRLLTGSMKLLITWNIKFYHLLTICIQVKFVFWSPFDLLKSGCILSFNLCCWKKKTMILCCVFVLVLDWLMPKLSIWFPRCTGWCWSSFQLAKLHAQEIVDLYSEIAIGAGYFSRELQWISCQPEQCIIRYIIKWFV